MLQVWPGQHSARPCASAQLGRFRYVGLSDRTAARLAGLARCIIQAQTFAQLTALQAVRLHFREDTDDAQRPWEWETLAFPTNLLR